jgi:extradiol dioxygenase family protein
MKDKNDTITKLQEMYKDWFLVMLPCNSGTCCSTTLKMVFKPVQQVMHSLKRLDDGRYKVANVVGHTIQPTILGDQVLVMRWYRLDKRIIDCCRETGEIS